MDKDLLYPVLHIVLLWLLQRKRSEEGGGVIK